MAACWVILRGRQMYTVIQAVHSLLYIVSKCHFFSVDTWKDTKNIYTNVRGVLTSVRYCIFSQHIIVYFYWQSQIWGSRIEEIKWIMLINVTDLKLISPLTPSLPIMCCCKFGGFLQTVWDCSRRETGVSWYVIRWVHYFNGLERVCNGCC